MFEYLMVCLECFDKTVGCGITMVMMLHWFLQVDSHTGADPKNRIPTSEEELARDDLSEVGKQDDAKKIRSLSCSHCVFNTIFRF